MWVNIIIAVILFAAGYMCCILMTSAHIDSRLEEYQQMMIEKMKERDSK